MLQGETEFDCVWKKTKKHVTGDRFMNGAGCMFCTVGLLQLVSVVAVFKEFHIVVKLC